MAGFFGSGLNVAASSSRREKPHSCRGDTVRRVLSVETDFFEAGAGFVIGAMRDEILEKRPKRGPGIIQLAFKLWVYALGYLEKLTYALLGGMHLECLYWVQMRSK